MMNKNEIIEIREAISKVVENYNVSIKDEINKIRETFNNEEIKMYMENPTSEFNLKIKILNDFMELMGDKNIEGVDIMPILKTEAILTKYAIIKSELTEEVI